jgi:hypothetical protein
VETTEIIYTYVAETLLLELTVCTLELAWELALSRELSLELALAWELAWELALELALAWESAERATTEAECARLEAESSAEVLRVQVNATKEVRAVDERATVVEEPAEATSISISGESAITVHTNAIRTDAHVSTIETTIENPTIETHSLEVGMMVR